MKNYRGYLIFIGLVAALLIPKFFCGTKKMDMSSGKPGGGGPKMAIKVGVQVVQPETVSPEYQVSGTLVANEQVQLSSETQGLIRKVYFKEGERVSKGELLLKINDADFQAQLKKALANKKLKEETVNRNQILLKKEAISQNDFDISVTDLNAIEADIDYLREMIRKTEIRAPFNGTIGLRNVSEGAYITTNTSIASLEDESQLKLEFSIPEKYALKVAVGDQLSFTVSGSEEVFKAKIYASDASVSSETRSIKMRAICANTNHKLMPGLFATIRMKLGSDKSSFMIPTQSVVPILKGQKVFLVQGDSAVERIVKTGFRTETKIEITEGLQAGDSLIVNGIMYMKNGVKVKVGKN
ncbi:MAG: efflux transporter periplasmic adaptor subunit [Bacteroidetes bacterium B1(2017)]|nr:MAG: efflux transporter periplasmic adaptor subunit [Bacteroidetes bacterium B1(2017)]